MAEMELYAQCDAKDTCEYIEENMASARDQITDALLPMDRDAVITGEGKRRLKKHIVDKLNVWLPRGKIENIFISNLIVD